MCGAKTFIETARCGAAALRRLTRDRRIIIIIIIAIIIIAYSVYAYIVWHRLRVKRVWNTVYHIIVRARGVNGFRRVLKFSEFQKRSVRKKKKRGHNYE